MQGRIMVAALLLVASSWASAGFLEGHAAYGRGDYQTALKEFRPLAEAGVARAQYGLGVMYDNGEGVPQDYAEALRWYRKAAEQGGASAQYNLGNLYRRGQGVPQDYIEAHKWFNLSAVAGDADAVNNRDLVEKKMTGAQIAEAQKLAREWMARH